MPEQDNKKKNAERHGEERFAGFDIQTILRDLLYQWWLVVTAFIVAATAFGAYKNMTFEPRYRASTTFFVGVTGVNTSHASKNLAAAETLTKNFRTIAESDILRSNICDIMGRSSLDADIRVDIVESTNLLTVTVEAATPRDTYEIIHLVVDEGLKICGSLDEDMMVRTMSEASIPTAPFNETDQSRNMLRMGILAAAAMVLLIAAMTYYRDTVKNEQDFRRKIDARLIGTIFHERKYKTFKARLRRGVVSMAMTNPSLSFRFVEANRLIATDVSLEMKRRGVKRIMVTSVSENEGKSTVAANLAIAMAQSGTRVCLLDCDFRKPAQYKIFEVSDKQYADNDLYTSMKKNLQPMAVTLAEYDNLTGYLTVHAQKSRLSLRSLENLEELLTQLEQEADIIIMDTAPWGLVADGVNLAAHANVSLLVVEQDMVPTRVINDTLDELRDTPADLMGCVFNNVFTSVTGSEHYGYGSYYGYGAYGRYGHYEKNYRKTTDEQKGGTAR